MSFKTIAVHLDTTTACRRRVLTALNLAKTHGARILGVAALYQPIIPAYAESQIGAELIAEQINANREALEDIGKSFESMAADAGVECSWCLDHGDPVDILSARARYADLMVLSQFDPDSGQTAFGHDLPDHILLGAGRPVVMVPYIHEGDGFGKHIMIGWDASRTAARAVSDALPFLAKAEKTTILSVNPDSVDDGTGSDSATNLAGYLKSHGVDAEIDHISGVSGNIGDVMLSRAAEVQADMIVIGGYGHARWRELVLGGVTRHMLTSMPLPVFMSH